MSESAEAARRRVAAYNDALRRLAQAHRDEFRLLHVRARADAGLPPLRSKAVR